MSDSRAWFITGASRGLGVDIVRAALDAGHAVVATGRTPERVSAAVGAHDDLLVAELDVTDPASAQAAVDAAVHRFGRIDVLVDDAGTSCAGCFETVGPEQLRAQMETGFSGPLDVTRAVLPVLRRQRSGQIITVTSAAGLLGQEFCAAYAPSKFALEGWMESLRFDLPPRGSPRRPSSPAPSAPSCSSRVPRRAGPRWASRTARSGLSRPSPPGRP